MLGTGCPGTLQKPECTQTGAVLLYCWCLFPLPCDDLLPWGILASAAGAHPDDFLSCKCQCKCHYAVEISLLLDVKGHCKKEGKGILVRNWAVGTVLLTHAAF